MAYESIFQPQAQPPGVNSPQVTTLEGWVDPATGKLLKVPQTPDEMQAAQIALENFSNDARMKNWQGEYDFAQKPLDTESLINKGTEEIGESQMNDAMRLQQQAAAMGFGNSGGLQQGAQAQAAAYSGQRANLARDVRSEADRYKSAMTSDVLRRKPVPSYDLAGLGFGGRAGGGGGGGAGGQQLHPGSTHISTSAGGPSLGPSNNSFTRNKRTGYNQNW